MCCSTRLEYTRSNDPLASMRRAGLSLGTNRHRSFPACSARAWSSIGAEMSTPVTAAK